ncbi:cell division protein FtsQ/DivIB [Phreatobacter sp.]|uniref:cell division protein FtsQ/DivIB n=1 Tax=Phreatobacter sp. TaxID=1966341 RepID=UPI003F72C9C7
MDGVGRFSRSLNTGARGAAAGPDGLARRSATLPRRPGRLAIRLRRLVSRVGAVRLPRRIGILGTALLFAATGLYGIQRGDHGEVVREALVSLGDMAANAAGLQVAAVRLTGNARMSHGEVLAAAGIRADSSVLFFDPAGARARLRASPWIADATIEKIYPNDLQISVVEREPYALWQRDGRIAVISEDGAVIVDHLDARFRHLPLVVGKGADQRVREIIGLMADFPTIAPHVRAATLVAERRWTLVLKNGTDVRLPDADIDRALARLVRLDEDRRLMSRDVTMIDLRLPDRVTVRLSDEAMKLHEAALRDRERARRRALGQRT